MEGHGGERIRTETSTLLANKASRGQEEEEELQAEQQSLKHGHVQPRSGGLPAAYSQACGSQVSPRRQ